MDKCRAEGEVHSIRGKIKNILKFPLNNVERKMIFMSEILAGGAKALPGWRRKHPGDAW